MISILLCLLCTLPTLPAHLVGIPAVVADHLRAFVRDVLGDGGQEIGGGEAGGKKDKLQKQFYTGSIGEHCLEPKGPGLFIVRIRW